MVGIALGGLGVVSLRVPFTLSYSFLHLLDLPSVLWATFLVAIFALIAYFTNPTEASFRAFLTELAFRQHLSRLNEAQDIDADEYDDDARLHNSTRPLDHKGARKHGTPSGHGSDHSHASTSTNETPIVFHFANKASVSLRTPGYHFRSFAVLTFAIISPVEMAIAPVPTHNPGHVHAQPPKPISWSNPSTHGAWFIGAFGRWWLGLEMNMHSRQVRLAGQDDAALREKELARSRGDDAEPNGNRHEDTFPPHKVSKSGIPRRSSTAALPRTKAALRERLSLQTGSSHKRESHTHPHAPPRPTTPPPLPKSASLPLHAKRAPPPSPEARKSKGEGNGYHNPPLLPTTIPDTGCSPRTRTPSMPDHSPVIADILNQLDAARSATTDLYTQLTDFQKVSTSTHASLHTEVDSARARKKHEDAGRAELKARTKVLDDARRQADGSKREAEKRFKAATAARDGATGRIERLGREVEELQQRMVDESSRAEESRARATVERGEISEALEAKREEIKVAEDVALALAARARDLEGNIAEETERLQKMKEAAKARRQQHSPITAFQADTSSWPPPLTNSAKTSPRMPVASHQLSSTLGTDTARLPTQFSSSPHPHPLVLGGISSFTTSTGHNGNTVSDGHYAPSQFRPFADSPISPSSTTYTGPLSPVSASLIPSGLIQSMESLRPPVLSNDSFLGHHTTLFPLAGDELQSPVDDPLRPSHVNRFDSQRAVLPPRPRSHSHEDEPVTAKPRRWFSAAGKEKGLNPDAKVFTLPHGRPLTLGSNSGASTPPAFGSDAFHSGATNESPPPRLSVAGSFLSSLHNAFTPSPAEREALQRVLGSGNTSLERVSSHGSGSGSGGGGSQHSSPHWGGEPRRDVGASGQRSFFNPWAGTEGKK